jgi:adenosine deaminase
MTSNFLTKLPPLTKEMIDELPICDIHVHLPGAISANSAWKLGVRNGLITVEQNEKEEYFCTNGPNSLSIEDPHEHYLDIFNRDLVLDLNGEPKNLKYDLDFESFKSFDRIMATVQGHRNPPGGIQTKEDIMFLLDDYLDACIRQKIFYTELQQNIKIAYLLYPDENRENARKQLYLLFAEAVEKFKSKGVHLRFLHCFNKTKAAGESKSTHERTLEAATWLEEAKRIAPGVFVGIQSAGHEKDETGWPVHLKAGYDRVRELGLGCEAHGGEGIGVEHMLDVVKTLPIKRIAHGFQVIEDLDAIEHIKQIDLTLVMMPIINLNLGLCLHIKDGKPCAQTKGGEKTHFRELWQHPFFDLFRKHKVTITLSSDNPEIGGVPIKKTILALAGLDDEYTLPEGFQQLTAQELVTLCINAADAIFEKESIKAEYKKLLSFWIQRYTITKGTV